MEAQLEDILKILPDNSGVYLMKDDSGKIIYVGKAKNLKNRVRSYFHGPKDVKTTVLVSKIRNIDWIITNSEYEALILENTLIKQHNPRYNINLKDGKTYPSIKISNEAFPRVYRTRRINNDGAEYFGPFTKVHAIDIYLDLIEAHFPLRKCTGPLIKRAQPCLYFHIKKCGGPCIGAISANEYDEQVDNVRALLSGKSETLVNRLKKSMEQASKNLAFEKAASIRDSIRAIEHIDKDQIVNDYDQEGRDYIAVESFDDIHCFSVLKMREGKMVGNDSFRTAGVSDGSELMSEFLLQYYTPEITPPSSIFIKNSLELDWWPTYAEERFQQTSAIFNPLLSRDTAIIEMAQENARQDLRRSKHEMGNIEALEEMQKVLKLSKLPIRIEGFDIAQLHGKHTVAALVSFWKGRPDTKNYRIFNIKSLKGGIDDYQAISEAVARRYQKLLNEERELPDLILIDGGRGQLNAARAVLDALGLEGIELASLAKQFEEIYRPDLADPIVLPKGNSVLRILQHVRDETHRFGTTRNQKLRSKTLSLEHLESIPGVGPKTAKALIEKYLDIQSILAAPLDELRSISKLGEAKTQVLLDELRNIMIAKGYAIDTGESLVAEDLPPTS